MAGLFIKCCFNNPRLRNTKKNWSKSFNKSVEELNFLFEEVQHVSYSMLTENF